MTCPRYGCQLRFQLKSTAVSEGGALKFGSDIWLEIKLITKICIQNTCKWKAMSVETCIDCARPGKPWSFYFQSNFFLAIWAICLWKSWSTGLLINHWQLALEDLSKNTSFSYHLSEVNDLLYEHCMRNVQRENISTPIDAPYTSKFWSQKLGLSCLTSIFYLSNPNMKIQHT